MYHFAKEVVVRTLYTKDHLHVLRISVEKLTWFPRRVCVVGIAAVTYNRVDFETNGHSGSDERGKLKFCCIHSAAAVPAKKIQFF